MGIEIKLTDRCNLACSYCYYRANRPHPDLSPDAVYRAIDYFADVYRQRGYTEMPVTFFGGEPLLCTDVIFQTVDYYSANPPADIHLSFYVCTNGTYLTKTLIDELYQRDIAIFLSLDGRQGVHDAHRKHHNGNGSYQEIEPILEYLAPKCKSIEMIISPDTAMHTADSVRFMIELGYREIIAMPDFTCNWTRSQLSELGRQYEQIAAMYLDYRSMNMDFIFTPLYDKIQLYLQDKTYLETCCNMGVSTYVISTESKIYPCTRFACDIPGNNYSIGDLETGLDHSALKRIITAHHRDRTNCGTCSIRSRCVGNQCGCIAFSFGKGLDYVSPLVCEYERMLVAIADGLGEKLLN